MTEAPGPPPPAQPVLEDAWLAGERAALRPVVPADAERAFAALHGRREILDWLVWGGPETPADLEEHYRRWRRGGDEPARAADGGRDYALAIVDLEDGCFAGSIGLRSAAHAGTGDLGYWVAADRWGRGLASEAVRLTSWLALGPLRMSLLFASVFLGNQASRRALEKSGFTVERQVELVVDGVPRQEWCLAATRRSFLRAVGDWRPRASRVELREARGSG